MIKLKNLSKNYGKQLVLNQLNEQFSLGATYGIVGLNGAGKTTFFNLLSKVLKPTDGELLLNDQLLSLRDIGYLETDNFFYSSITGNEYLKIFEQTNIDFNLEAIQHFFNLPLDDLIETYSTGMKKKLALLAILKQDKAIYLFDEPFNGLDLETNKVLELIIQRLKEKGKTLFISSHIIDPLLVTCDEIHFLENGQFSQHFKKADFGHIEERLFGKFKEDVQKTIINAI